METPWPKLQEDRKSYSLNGKVFWQSGAKEDHKVTAYNEPHIRDLLGGKNPRGWLPLVGWETAENCYRISWREVEISRVEIDGSSSPEPGLFTLWGRGLGPAIRTVTVFFGWNLVIGGPWGGTWPLLCLKRLTEVSCAQHWEFYFMTQVFWDQDNPFMKGISVQTPCKVMYFN